MYKILRIGSAGIMSVFKFGDSSDGYITLTDDLRRGVGGSRVLATAYGTGMRPLSLNSRSLAQSRSFRLNSSPQGSRNGARNINE